MESDYATIKAYLIQLDNDKLTCERRLVNASTLMRLLGGEGERWKVTVEELNRDMEKLAGNVFISAASISYMGPFSVLFSGIYY